MAQKTDAQLTTDANVIGNETTANANTADRVRDHLVDQIDSKMNNEQIIDEDDMVSDSATHVPTQQSVKAYVDASAGGGGHTIEDEGTPLTQRTKLNFVGAGVTVTDDSGDDASVVTIPLHTVNTSSALTDGASITITGAKHTLTSDEATITWTLSQVEDFQTTDIILTVSSAVWTFPANTLCVVEGVASEDNTATLSGTANDHYIMSIYKDGTNYRIVIKNFKQ